MAEPALIDITLRVTPKHEYDTERYNFLQSGHLGTHFDVMNKEFPLAFVKRQAVVFDVTGIRNRDIAAEDIKLADIKPGMFVAFRTGYGEEHTYGTRAYFDGHPQLSDALIDALLQKDVSIIGVDCAGIRRGKEHTPRDQYCADHGVFVVENLCGLQRVLAGEKTTQCLIYTFPVNFEGMTGLPCRVVAEK